MYVVIELQKQSENTLASIVTKYDIENEAMSKFYAIMSAAAVSSVPVHSAVVLSEEGYPIKNDHYIHEEVNNG